MSRRLDGEWIGGRATGVWHAMFPHRRLAVSCFAAIGLALGAAMMAPASLNATPAKHHEPTPTPAAAPALTATATPGPTAPPVSGSWTLKFADEFNGSSLDLNKWRPNWAWWLTNADAVISKPVNDAELSCYDPGAVTEGNGVVTLTAVQQPCTANNGVTYAYRSGLIESYNHFQFTYGYMEARMWLPQGAGTPVDWPAFWANGVGPWPTNGEIDIMEVLGGRNPLCWHFHYSGGAPGDCPRGISNPTGWHTFGADWEPRSITFYYDGVRVGRVSKGVTSSPMYVIVNLAISTTVGGPLSVPAKVDIDYVHVWQRT